MRPRTRALVVGYPLTEILVAMGVASVVGWGLTVLLLVAGIPVGMLLVASAGRGAVASLRASAAPLSPGGVEIGAPASSRHAWRAAAGALIAIPGFVTDVVGVLILVPAVQRLVSGRLRGRITVLGGTTMTEGTVVRGTVVDDDPRARGSDGNGPSSPVGELGPS